MLALLNSDLSLLLKSGAGTGKSLATSLFLLSNSPTLSTSTIPSVTNLLLVPSPSLAFQYYTQISKMLKNSPLNINSVVQHVSRTDQQGEQKQIDLLEQYPGPHILIGTPTRILDILSSPKKSALPLFNLSSIVLDEAETLIPKAQVFSVLKRTNNLEHDHSKSIPTQILLNHIVPWRNTYVEQNSKVFVPLKFLIESSNASNYLKVVAMKNKWISGRPMPRLGTDEQDHDYAGFDKQELPNDVSSYFVTYNSSTGQLTDTDYDVSSVIPEFDTNALKAIADLGRRRVSQNVKEYASLSKQSREKLMEDYADALSKTMALSSNVKANDGENPKESENAKKEGNVPAPKPKRALVVIPEAYSLPLFLSVLEKRHGIKGASIWTKHNECKFYYKNEQGDAISIDTDTFFKQQQQQQSEEASQKQDDSREEKDLKEKTKENEPSVLVVRAREVAGLDFPGLDHIYAIGWDSILQSKTYLTVAGRSRAASAHEKERRVESPRQQQQGSDEPTKSVMEPKQCKFVVISLLENTEDMRYNILIAGTMKKLSVEQKKMF